MVERYLRDHAGINASGNACAAGAENMPKSVIVPGGLAGPHGGPQSSAEAHSAPALSGRRRLTDGR